MICADVAGAEDSLKGTYMQVGTQICLGAPDGFKNDSKGSPAIPNGPSVLSLINNQGQATYNGDGTGKATGTYLTTTAPPAPGASVAGGTYSYSFTYAPLSDGSYSVTFTPGTYKGAIEFGPATGKQFTIDVGYRTIQVSNDSKRITVKVATPYVEKIAYSGTPVQQRICSFSGSHLRID
jgi:hypothetical protein